MHCGQQSKYHFLFVLKTSHRESQTLSVACTALIFRVNIDNSFTNIHNNLNFKNLNLYSLH